MICPYCRSHTDDPWVEAKFGRAYYRCPTCDRRLRPLYEWELEPYEHEMIKSMSIIKRWAYKFIKRLCLL